MENVTYSQQWLTELDTCASTNTWLIERHKQFTTGDVVWTKEQTAGRGQRNKVWVSDARSLTFSMLVEVQSSDLNRIGLISGLAVCHVLDDIFSKHNPGLRCSLKWPNDVVVSGGKLAGILCETIHQHDGTARAVIGIGINHRNRFSANQSPTLFNGVIPPISLSDLLSQCGEGIELILAVRRYLLEGIGMLSLDQWGPLHQQIQKRDWLMNHRICLESSGETLTGTASGIASSGQLLVTDDSGIQHALFSGQLTLLNAPKETP